MEIINCVFCVVSSDLDCPYCGGLEVAAIDPEKGLRPLTDAELLATCEAVTVGTQADETAS